MTEIDLDDLDTTVAAMLDDAGAIALGWFRTAMTAENKAGAFGFDPVTEADRAIEDLLRSRLHDAFGEHEVIGEERGASGRPGRYRWLIDPIDGTKSFVTGSPLWGILLGLLDDGRPVAGWLHQPYIGETFAAVAGAAWMQHGAARVALRTRERTSMSDAHLYTTFPGSFRTATDQAAFARLTATAELTRFGGDCYAYALLAMGQIDLVVEATLNPYDIVPLIPIVEAAGGVVSGRNGESAVDGGFVVASANATIHAQALEIVNRPDR